MYEKFVLTDFEIKSKYGLPAYFELLCERDAIRGTYGRLCSSRLNFNTIKMTLTFKGMMEDCDALFDDGKFLSLRFSFYNASNGNMLWISYADVKKENNLELSEIIYQHKINGQEHKSYFYPIIDESLLKIYMRSKQPEGQDIRDILPELSVIGVYDFRSDEFNRRMTLANMLVI